MEQIIANLDKAKLKLDEAFFYLDEIEELIEGEDFEPQAAERVSKANERLCSELSALSGRVTELQGILRMFQERQEGGQDVSPDVSGPGAEHE